MEAMECIRGRRSVRKFTECPVTEEEAAQIVEAASYAPTWKNTQTVRYTFVTDPAVKQRLANECVMGFSHNQGIMSGAPAVMVLSTVTGRSGFERDGSFSTSQGTHWQSFDAGAAAQTFCLAAHAKGLGTVIMGIYDAEKVAEVIQLPEGEMVSALIAVGHPDEAPAAPARKGVEVLLRTV